MVEDPVIHRARSHSGVDGLSSSFLAAAPVLDEWWSEIQDRRLTPTPQTHATQGVKGLKVFLSPLSASPVVVSTDATFQHKRGRHDGTSSSDRRAIECPKAGTVRKTRQCAPRFALAAIPRSLAVWSLLSRHD